MFSPLLQYLNVPYMNAFMLIIAFEMENKRNPAVELQSLVCSPTANLKNYHVQLPILPAHK